MFIIENDYNSSSQTNQKLSMEGGDLLFSLIFLLISSIYCSSAELDPYQLGILRSSFNVSAGIDPCTDRDLPSNVIVVCDSDNPFRHLISLQISNCSKLSISVVQEIPTLTQFSLVNCPIQNFQWREIENMTKIETLVISNATGLGYLPDKWPMNLTFIDLSLNSIQGTIPRSISSLQSLLYLNLSRNSLHDAIPDWIGDMVMLKNLSLASNFLSGNIPESMAAMKSLVHLDLSNNRLTGSIPDFIADMVHLKYLNLEGNLFKDELPFNHSFVSRLEVFRIGGNKNLCYDQAKLQPKSFDLGNVGPCYQPGPTGLVVAVGYALMFVFLLVIVLVLTAKFCRESSVRRGIMYT